MVREQEWEQEGGVEPSRQNHGVQQSRRRRQEHAQRCELRAPKRREQGGWTRFKSNGRRRQRLLLPGRRQPRQCVGRRQRSHSRPTLGFLGAQCRRPVLLPRAPQRRVSPGKPRCSKPRIAPPCRQGSEHIRGAQACRLKAIARPGLRPRLPLPRPQTLFWPPLPRKSRQLRRPQTLFWLPLPRKSRQLRRPQTLFWPAPLLVLKTIATRSLCQYTRQHQSWRRWHHVPT